MKYVGSKYRLSKYILPIILKNRKTDQYYVEPFLGGGEMLTKVTGNRIGSDINQYAVEALKLIRDYGEYLPKTNEEFTKQMYLHVKNNKIFYSDAFIGFVGYAYSFGAMFFSSWRRDNKNRDYVKEAYNSAIRQQKKLQGAIILKEDYRKLDIPDNSIIYCDPPYKNTMEYKHKIDHNEFWNWTREKSKQGHEVFISEYNAPDDFECIWEKETKLNIAQQKRNSIEKLFKYKNC